jgi:hypothetical protein
MSKLKSPVIPSQQTDKDAKTGLNNLREFFSAADQNGGVITMQDLIDMGLVNKSGVKIK